MKKRNKKIKVLVAMSGGVDSSVAAALLLKQGYDVTGAFMKQWSDSADLHGVCQWKQDRRDALRVAARLGIPLLTLDFEKEYLQQVTKYMFAEYKKGRTPNPDVLCNKYIKFGVWLDKAMELRFEYLATGHYAQIYEEYGFHLLMAKDKEKDQTYFLHQLNQEQLSHTLFPIGEYTKPQVRALARKFKLPTAEREESMGICFVGEVPMKEFLQQKIKPRPGKILLPSGEAIGEHEGLPFYTVGQRHGCGESEIRNPKSETNSKFQIPNSKPLYVIEKRLDTNELVVGYEDNPLHYKREIGVGNVHWVSGQSPTLPLQCLVRLRHRQMLQKCRFAGNILRFTKAQRAVTPGQFAVFYLKGECLGGGVIC